MKILGLAFLAGIGYKTGEFLWDCLYNLIPSKKKNHKTLYEKYHN